MEHLTFLQVAVQIGELVLFLHSVYFIVVKHL